MARIKQEPPQEKIRGVTLVTTGPRKGQWRAEILVNGQMKRLGWFNTKDEAAYVVDEARRWYSW